MVSSVGNSEFSAREMSLAKSLHRHTHTYTKLLSVLNCLTFSLQTFGTSKAHYRIGLPFCRIQNIHIKSNNTQFFKITNNTRINDNSHFSGNKNKKPTS